MLGGSSNGGSSTGAQQSIYVFNPATNSWSLSPVQLPGTRFDFSGNIYKGRLYAFGGSDASSTPVAFSIKTDILTNTVLWSTASTANSINVTPINTSTYYVTVSDGINSCTDSVKITVQDFLANLAAVNGGSQVCKSSTVSGIGTYYIALSCELIAKVQPSGASPVSGTINSCVIIDPSVQYYNAEPYVQRHYDIEPVNNPATSTATVTLYFKDQEFINFNANNSGWPDLPTVAGGGNSDPNISNVRVTQYHGVPIAPHNAGNPAPGYYTTNAGININPTSVNYNSTYSYWEVTLNVNGFSGFYLHSRVYPLPITLYYFKGIKQGNNHLLNWKVTCNSNNGVKLSLERSADSRNYLSIHGITADALRCQQPFEYVDLQPMNGINYYRLKMVDAEGKITYSSIVALLNASKGFEIINTAPNPVTGSSFKLNVASTQSFITEILIRDIQGRLMKKQSIRIITGFNSIDINVGNLAAGSYIISANTAEDKSKTFSFVKE